MARHSPGLPSALAASPRLAALLAANGELARAVARDDDLAAALADDGRWGAGRVVARAAWGWRRLREQMVGGRPPDGQECRSFSFY